MKFAFILGALASCSLMVTGAQLESMPGKTLSNSLGKLTGSAYEFAKLYDSKEAESWTEKDGEIPAGHVVTMTKSINEVVEALSNITTLSYGNGDDDYGPNAVSLGIYYFKQEFLYFLGRLNHLKKDILPRKTMSKDLEDLRYSEVDLDNRLRKLVPLDTTQGLQRNIEAILGDMISSFEEGQ